MESIFLLAFLGALFVCGLIVAVALYRIARHRPIGPVLRVLAVIASTPFVGLLYSFIFGDEIEYNPHIHSPEHLVGTYRNNDHVIVLNQDRTYSAFGVSGLRSGTWSSEDWNLTLTNSTLKEPRVITRNSVLCIAPYYDGVDAPPGELLAKTEERVPE